MAIGMLRGGGSNSRFRSLLDGLKAEGDLARQEGALTELCDMLCMATEETLQGFSMDSFLPPLIALINCEVFRCFPLLHLLLSMLIRVIGGELLGSNVLWA
jgi:hypothetical protein